MQNDNFLILDEPTNHLDIDSREVLEVALNDFDGTLLFVSHDRYFINQVATSVVEVSPEGTELFLGDYDYYIDKKQEQAEIAAAAASQAAEKLLKPVQRIQPVPQLLLPAPKASKITKPASSNSVKT